jgi:probable phosphomutase (TIGR03848 family)
VATVLLLRHGRTATNADGTLAGRGPVGLDDLGMAQARAAGARLAAAALPLAAVVTSPLERCRRTVELALPQATATLDERFIECGYGAWTNQPLKRLAREPLWAAVQAHPAAVTFPGDGGESMAAMSARAVAAVRDWDARVTAGHGPEAVWLACGHGDVIKAIVADALGLHLDLFQRIVVDPSSITVIRYTPLRPFVVRLNDTGSDLSGLAPSKRRRRVSRKSTLAGSDAAVGGGSGPATAGAAVPLPDSAPPSPGGAR